MASSGPNSPGTGANDTGIGTRSWSSVGNIVSSDNNKAQVTSSGSTSTSHYLKATNFGFSIPSGATIDGIVVEIERSVDLGPPVQVRDNVVRIIKGGTILGTNKAATTTDWPDSADAYASYGSTSDLWGTTWTDSDINSSNFGAALSINMSISKFPVNCFVDHVRITVHYTAGGGPTSASALLLAGD